MHKSNFVIGFITFLYLAVAYQAIIFSPLNLGPDFNFVSYDHFRTYSSHPYLWDSSLNDGFGGYILFTLLFQPYSQIARLWTYLFQNPFLLHKLIFLIPTISLGLSSAYYASRHLLNNPLARATFILLYLTNPYIILLISGGQLGVALAYMFLPVFFTSFYNLSLIIHHHKHISPLRLHATALTVPIFIILDARLFLLGALLVLPIYLYLLYQHRRDIAKPLSISLKILILSTVLTFLIHAHWLIPAIYLEPVSLPQGYSSNAAVGYFSFTRFAHAFSWSHPNYPENIFGKVKEISAWALIFPLLAFSAFRLRPRKLVTYFTIVSLVAIFLAKGTNEPFGDIYVQLFSLVPGFSLFRDSTKFYVLISLCYSYLISITMSEQFQKLNAQNLGTTLQHAFRSIREHFFKKTKSPKNRPKISLKRPRYKPLQTYQKKLHQQTTHIFSAFAKIRTIYLLMCVIATVVLTSWWPTFSNQIRGTLAYRAYPESYQKLQQFLQSDTQFGRVLYLPTREIYGYTSLNHPAVNFDLLTRPPTCHPQFCQELPTYPSDHLFTTTDLATETDLLLQKLLAPNVQGAFQDLAIKYLLLAPDYDKNIYTHDYKPYQPLYQQYRTFLDQHSELRQVFASDDLVLYQTTFGSAFISDRLQNQGVDYQQLSPTHYQIFWSGGVGKIHISQSFDPRWQLSDSIQTYKPERTAQNTIFYRVNTNPTVFELTYFGQSYADLGWGISQITTFFIFIYLLQHLLLFINQRFQK